MVQYTYVLNNPTNLIDPWGLFASSSILGGGGLISSAVESALEAAKSFGRSSSTPQAPCFDSITECVSEWIESMTDAELMFAISSGLFEAMGVYIPSGWLEGLGSDGHIDFNDLRQELAHFVADAIWEDSSGLGMDLLSGWVYNHGNGFSNVPGSDSREVTFNLPPLTVFIDPGHGGKETGSTMWIPMGTHAFIGLFPVHEKTINLTVSLMLRDILEAEGVVVYMSRTTDVDVSHTERARLANESGADLFVSVHHNSIWPHQVGTMVLYPIYERHGERSVISRELASHVNDIVIENTGLRDRGIEESNLYVLNQTNMPAIVTETGHMGRDILFLLNNDNLQTIAESIAQGILSF